ncbi:response regulator [Cyanobacterium aponinum IPPAS B-1201]|nr:response regulator [Cyanobacterium aponinum IPPAS B-1201]
MIATMTRKTVTSPNVKEIVAIPYKALQGLLAKKVSGKLMIQDPNDESVRWLIYLGEGKIHYAHSVNGKRERIRYLLSRCYPDHGFYIPQELEDDYGFICQHWRDGDLDMQKIRTILSYMTQEAIALCLALPRATISFEKIVGLDPLILNLSLKSLIEPVKSKVRAWVTLREHISSPFVRPRVNNWDILKTHFGNRMAEYQEVEQLKPYLDDRRTLYDIAAYSRHSVLDLALLLHPLIKSDIITISPFQEPTETEDKPLIACIDDSQAIQRIVKMTLIAGGFDVVSITEPAKAMSSFVRQKPDLILMDINMPDIDGYKLAYMLRQSALLKDIPILMLTGRDGVLDRVKAKMVGAVGYISKPFNPQELVQSIQDNIQKAV